MNDFDGLFTSETLELAVRAPRAGVPDVLAPFHREGRVVHPVQRRQNPLTGEWTHLNLTRAGRPIEPASPPAPKPGNACLFCPGSEARTPEEITGGDRLREGDPWSLRAFPNLFPWLLDHRNVVETPLHRLALSEADPDEEAAALLTGAELGREAEARGLVPVFFRNHGGHTSQPHPHWQSGALPRWPARDAQMHLQASAFYAEHRLNLFDVLWNEEDRRGERWIDCLGTWAVFCPFAPRFEHETWMVCTTDRASLASCNADELRAAGCVLAALLRALAETCGVSDVLVVAHQLPGEESCYRLFFEVCPGTIWAGAERGFSEWVVEHPPERTAQCLRGAIGARREEILAQAEAG